MTRDQIQSILRQKYDPQRWLRLLREILPGTDVFGNPQTIQIDHKVAKRASQLGVVHLKGGRQLAVLEIEVSDRIDVVRNRVGLRNFVARFIDQVKAHGVLAVFLSSEQDYRFTFAARESAFADDGALVTTETVPRRYTYVLGPNDPCRTAAERFAELATKAKNATLDDVLAAFSVERLNKEFFTIYKTHYQKFCAHLLDGDAPIRVFKLKLKGLNEKAHDRALKPVRDFVKKMIGRLVFLHFLQKKSWLGCPASAADWNNGDANFLRQLFDSAPAADQHRFHSRRLVPLFFDTLNRRRKNDLFAITGTRVPYLNGGLFERDFAGVEQIDFPAGLFRDLLEFFGQYNFTIDENDPDDHEIGIDPEMLGHIFENLLEDNKDKGAFYTPKAIVQYMCQQSLIHYLKTHLGDRPEIETLVRRKEVGDPADKQNWVRQNARLIEKLLDEVKICDPAIGSGAFPIGLLQEIYWLKLSLDWTLDRAKAKRDIIQHSIYGVDLDAGAVEIARLRFWLALIVEEDRPSPLPNLDYKIMQGNSLLESFEGIDLSNLTGKKRQAVQLLGTEQTELGLKAVSTELTVEFAEGKQAEITDFISGYFDQTDPEAKQRLHRKIDELVLGHIEYNLDLHEERMKAVLDNARKETKRKQAAARGYEPTKKEANRIAELEAQLAEVDRKRASLAELQEKPERPFFLWHLFFQDVFARGGFDIAIANPPYVRQEVIKDLKPALKAEHYQCYNGMADLYVYFYELSVRCLRPGGTLCFISSNSILNSDFGLLLRQKFLSDTSLSHVLDFAEAPVFKAVTEPVIIGLSKVKARENQTVNVLKWNEAWPIDRVQERIAASGSQMKQSAFSTEVWRLESPAVLALLAKVRSRHQSLGKIAGDRFYRGILTGLNEAFIIDRAQRDALIAEHASSRSIIQPFLRGKDIKKWKPVFSENYLIRIESSSNKTHPWSNHPPSEAERIFAHKYPAVFHWLNGFRGKLINRDDQGLFFWELRACAYWSEFAEPKIIYQEINRTDVFAYDDQQFLANNKVFILPRATKATLALLNSRFGIWFIHAFSGVPFGGFLALQTPIMSAFPVPTMTHAEETSLMDLVDGILVAQQARDAGRVAQLEAEIDAHVFRLYDLTSAEIDLVQLAQKKPAVLADAKTTLYERVLPQLKQASAYFTTDSIVTRMEELGFENSEGTLPVYLTEATATGLIHDAGRGWYSRFSQPVPLDPKPVAKLIRAVEKAFPLLDFTVWSTAQINPWMHHLLAQPVAFLHAPVDTLESVGDTLRAQGWEVAVNPAPSTGPKSVRPGERMVVLRPAMSKQPSGDGQQAAIEKILVDLVAEAPRLALMDISEAQGVVSAILNQFLVQIAVLQRYADSRAVKLVEVEAINQRQ